MVDTTGRKTVLTSEFVSVWGLAWSPNGREIWFTAAESSWQRLLAVTLEGRCRTVAEIPGELVLRDVAPDGRVLLASRRMGSGIRGRSSADQEEKELGWLGFPWARALSADGRMLLLEDQSETGGPSGTTYIRGMDGSLPVRLGPGSARALSPDGRWALTNQLGPPQRLVQIPTGTGDTLSLPRGRVETYQDASWLPGGRRIVFVGAEHGRPQRTWVQELPAGQPKPVTPEGTTGVATSPDGRWVAAITPDSMIVLFPLQGGEARSVARLTSPEEVCQWSADGGTLFVSRRGTRLDVFRIDVQTGKRQLWRSFAMPDPAGARIATFVVTPDGRSYAYGYLRTLDDLYLVEGLK
jgi:Tol biopolymer transport system component